MKPRIVLVTGGAGFIGSHLVDSLVKSGRKVRVYDNFSTGARGNLSNSLSRIDLIKGDIKNLKTLQKATKGVSEIYHLAAISSVLLSVEDPVSTWDSNITGTWNLLEAARREGVKRVVFASSASVYGALKKVPFVETAQLEGASPYATSKLLGEQFCSLYYRLYGLETVSLRFFSVYGPRQNPKSQYSAVIPNFSTKLLSGKTPTVYGRGTQTRDFIYIKDIIRAIRKAGHLTSVVGNSINVGTGQQTSIIKLLKLVQKITGKDIPPKFEPLKPGDDPCTCADTRKMKRLLGISAATSFQDGLAETVSWFAIQ
ncbi:MAG: GDP-mannose 4,6-dehydratase [candidate division Zixibacteria bacterium]|nr:GDP-mannose 4,6-dehydratase [candidate division Zixibacteria bacterium]